MAPTLEAEFRVLHSLRIKGAASADAVARLAGDAEVTDELAVLEQEGWVLRRSTTSTLVFALTASGRERHGQLLAGEGDDSSRAVLAAAYDGAFRPLNRTFKALCLRWQQADEHFELLEEVISTHDQIDAFLADAAEQRLRFSVYRVRLDALVERVQDGDTEAYVAPLGESYHNAWFELHEDLIITLGRSRAEEENAA
ncbi:MAG: hypothetical protein WCB67_01435 [Solirubrobacteraceae bacterium]